MCHHDQRAIVKHDKLSADLALALSDGPPGAAAAFGADEADRLSVFIAVDQPLGAEQAAHLRALGASSARPQDRLVTAQLNGAEVGAVSDLPWVSALSLARRRRPV